MNGYRSWLALLFLLPSFAWGAIAEDAFTYDAGGAGDVSFTHTPSGTPAGVVITLIQSGTTAETFTLTYGGSSLTEMTLSPYTMQPATGSDNTGILHAYYLGSSVPSGAQTVSITSRSGANNLQVGVWTVTAASNVTETDTSTLGGENVTNPSVTVSLASTSSFVAQAFKSGQNDITAITPLTNWTDDQEVDNGANTYGWYSYDVIGTADVSAGYTQGNDDANIFAFAISETGGGPSLTQINTIQNLGGGIGPHKSQSLGGLIDQ